MATILSLKEPKFLENISYNIHIYIYIVLNTYMFMKFRAGEKEKLHLQTVHFYIHYITNI